MRHFACVNGNLSKNEDTAVWQTIHLQYCIKTRNSESRSSLKFKEKRIVIIWVPKPVTDFESKLVEEANQ